MINWAGVAVAVLSLAYTGFRDFSRQNQLTSPIPQVQYVQQPQQQIVYYYLAYDPNTGRWYYNQNGLWYEQQTTPNQTQYQAPIQAPQGARGTPFGIGNTQFQPQAVANPWVR